MAFLDRFRTPKPATTGGRGGSGRQHTGGFLDEDERNGLLRGRRGIEVFEKMWRTDGDCRRALLACIVPVVSGTWQVDPPGTEADPTTPEEQEATDFLSWALFDPAGMSPQLPGHLMQVMRVAGRAGFAPFEQIYKLADWNGRQVITVKTLDLRRPQSVQRWLQDGPDLTAIEQWTPGARNSTDLAGPGPVQIPALDLVYYRFGAEGDNWEGESLLRPGYKHWKIKETLELMQAQALERSGKGIPTGYPPTGAGVDDIEAMQAFLEQVGKDDAGWFLAPGPHAQYADKGQGWYWEFVTPKDAKGAADAFKVALDYQSDKIAASVLEEFMRQGMSKVGTNATAETQQNPFLMFCEALAATVVEAPINEQLVPRLVALNFNIDRLPTVRCSLIDETTLTELADYVQKLTTAGALRPEPTLEGYLREKGDLPPADETAIAEQEAKAVEEQQRQFEQQAALKQPPDDGTAPASPPAKKATRTLSRADRPLKAHETHMSLDTIEAAIDGARDRFKTAAAPHAMALAADLAAKAAAGRRPKHGPPPADLVNALEREVQALYDTGRRTVREELARQAGHPVDAITLAAGEGGVARFVRDVALSAATNILAAIVSELLRAMTRRRDNTPVAVFQAQAQAAAEQAATGAVHNEALQHAAGTLNAGRSDQADAMADLIAGSRYTSILDGNRCSHCRQADDDVLRPLADPVRIARRPPNPDCEGGGRCRCMEAFQLSTEAAPAI